MFQFWGKELPESLYETVNPSWTAVLAIDLQNDFAHPKGYTGKSGGIVRGTAVLQPNRRLIEYARRSAIPVIYTRKLRRPDGSTDSAAFLAKSLERSGGREPRYCLEGTWGAEICDDVAPTPQDIIVPKYHRSAFTGTDLDFILRSRGTRTVVVTGLALSGCVEGTLRDAFELGYFDVVPKDCVADGDPATEEVGLRWIQQRMLLKDHLTTVDRLIEIWSDYGSGATQPGVASRQAASA